MYEIGEGGRHRPHKWASGICHCYRSCDDINYIANRADWGNVIRNYERNMQFDGIKRDADMMVVGIPPLTYEQNKTHFALWCMMNNILIIGCDVRTLDQRTVDLLKNKKLI